MDSEGADWGLHMQQQNGVSVQNRNPNSGEAVALEEAAQSSEMITSLLCGTGSAISPLSVSLICKMRMSVLILLNSIDMK